jgi:hypothetical protein
VIGKYPPVHVSSSTINISFPIIILKIKKIEILDLCHLKPMFGVLSTVFSPPFSHIHSLNLYPNRNKHCTRDAGRNFCFNFINDCRSFFFFCFYHKLIFLTESET